MNHKMNDKELKNRIVKGRYAIKKAKKMGKPTTDWELHLATLEINYYKSIIKNQKIRVKIGSFGFCTCSSDKYEGALCSGCYKIKSCCICKTIQASTKELLNMQYKREKKAKERIH